MGSSNVDVVIVGAGPYGLALASHLSHRRISRRIFGFPMSSWRQMPPGMFLKSFAFATNIPTPEPNCTLPKYCRERGLEDFEPVATAAFADYGDWFQQKFVPDVEQLHVTSVTQVNGGFNVTLENGEQVRAKRVVVAAGLGYFTHVPEVFSNLPPEMVTHASRTSEYLKTDYAGKDVTVIGSGQSALEAAALLHEGGARVRILARNDVWWSDKFSHDRSLRDKILNPNTVVGPGRINWVLQHLPWLAYHLPRDRRVRFTRRHLGPFGAWWLRHRVDGIVPIHRHTVVEAAAVKNGRIELRLRTDGEPSQLETDHILSATGYVSDIDRLPFIDRDLAARIRRIERAPELSPHFESSVEGLYFVGPVAAFSFGPLVRFVAGAPFTMGRLVPHVVRGL